MSIRILEGDCREVLRSLEPQSVHTCVTSPPYFGLRDYGHAGQIGLEPTPEEFIAELVSVFREVRRVLRDDGTLWVNMGDSYAGSGKGGNPPDSPHQKQGTNRGSLTVIGNTAREAAVTKGAGQPRVPRGSQLPAGLHESARQGGAIGRAWVPPPAGLKQKDLIGIPWMLAFALRADGWYLRQDIIWSKPNPMPESVQDRCTKAHEYIFLLSKSARYYCEMEAVAEPADTGWNGSEFHIGKTAEHQLGRASENRKPRPAGNKTNKYVTAYEHGDDVHRTKAGLLAQSGVIYETRNKRSVWTVATQPFKEAHFATFPPDLIEPCILAGCPEGGTVLDPFGGAGTTGLVADRHQRNAILCELNPAYIEIAKKRIHGDAPLFAEVS